MMLLCAVVAAAAAAVVYRSDACVSGPPLAACQSRWVGDTKNSPGKTGKLAKNAALDCFSVSVGDRSNYTGF